MVPLVFGHIAVMIYASQNGLSAEEILSRTQGSGFWAAFYGLFVAAVSLHAALGLRNILREWAGLKARPLSVASWGIGLLLFLMGLNAVYSVVARVA